MRRRITLLLASISANVLSLTYGVVYTPVFRQSILEHLYVMISSDIIYICLSDTSKSWSPRFLFIYSKKKSVQDEQRSVCIENDADNICGVVFCHCLSWSCSFETRVIKIQLRANDKQLSCFL